MTNDTNQSNNSDKICGVDKGIVYTFYVLLVFLLILGIISGLVMFHLYYPGNLKIGNWKHLTGKIGN